MKAMPKKGIALVTGFGLALTLAGCTSGSEEPAAYTSRDATDGTTDFVVIENPHGGATLSYSADSSIEILEVEENGSTYAFKDLNGNDELDTFEDWRVTPAERAAAYAETLTAEQISGLMLFSSHERSPGDGLTDAQKTYLSEDNLRNVLTPVVRTSRRTSPGSTRSRPTSRASPPPSCPTSRRTSRPTPAPRRSPTRPTPRPDPASRSGRRSWASRRPSRPRPWRSSAAWSPRSTARSGHLERPQPADRPRHRAALAARLRHPRRGLRAREGAGRGLRHRLPEHLRRRRREHRMGHRLRPDHHQARTG